MTHEHHFEFQGVAAWPDEYPMPGSGAYAMNYADVYFCVRCCDLHLKNERVLGSSYEKLRNNAILYEEKPT